MFPIPLTCIMLKDNRQIAQNLMPNSHFNTQLAEAIAAINTPKFTSRLMALLGALLSYDCAVILGYREGKHPIYLYDSIESERELLFQRYLITSFQDDPFYQKLVEEKQQGIFTLKDVKTNQLEYQAYYQQFYQQTGWKDELSMLIKIEPSRWVMLYFGYLEEGKRFTQQQVSRLQPYFSIIQALCQQHWHQTEFVFAEPVFSATSYSREMRLSIEQAVGSFGERVLTKREQQIAALLVQGSDTNTISSLLGVTQGTVKNHRKRIYAQLNIASLSELFQLFLNHLITQSR